MAGSSRKSRMRRRLTPALIQLLTAMGRMKIGIRSALNRASTLGAGCWLPKVGGRTNSDHVWGFGVCQTPNVAGIGGNCSLKRKITQTISHSHKRTPVRATTKEDRALQNL